MLIYHFNISELEEEADNVKVFVLRALVREGLLNEECAKEWCESHTIVIRRSYFRKLYEKVMKREGGNLVYHVVKSV